MNNSGNKKAAGYKFNPTLCGIPSVLIWGISLPLIKYLQHSLGLFLPSAATALVSGVIGLAFERHRRAIRFRDVLHTRWFYIRFALFLTYMFSLVFSLYMSSPETLPLTIFLNYLWPTFVIIFSMTLRTVYLKRLFLFLFGVLVIITSLGYELTHGKILDILGQTTFSVKPLILAGFGAICWGLYSAIGRKHGAISGGGNVLCLFQLASGIIFLIFAGFNFQQVFGDVSHIDLKLVGAAIFYGCFSCAANYSWDYGSRRGDIIWLSLLADFIPWISLFSASIILGIPLTPTLFMTALLLFVGAFMVRMSVGQTLIVHDQAE